LYKWGREKVIGSVQYFTPTKYNGAIVTHNIQGQSTLGSP
jgi:hypothetical protein